MSQKERQIMAENEMERKMSTLAIGWIGIFLKVECFPQEEWKQFLIVVCDHSFETRSV